MKLNRVLFLFLIPLYMVSCSTQKKYPTYNYVQNLSDTSDKGEVKIPELRIQKNDQLYIRVYSVSTRPDVSDAMFNLTENDAQGATGGFLVDINGNIEYPRLGTIHAEGLTKQELAAEIKKRLTQPEELLRNPTVIIRFINYRVTVMGEVAKEGPITVPGERITILEAIGLAGGIKEFGKKNTVKVVREIDGKREVGVVDLSSKSLFESPFYNLMQNDIVFVDPSKMKAKQAEQSVVAQRVTFALSLITAAAFIYNIFK